MNYLKKEIKNNFCIITLNRPEFKNAFNAEMIFEITEIFKLLNQDLNIKAVILKGEGTVFCAGADLNWMKSMVQFSYEENLADSEKLWNMFESIQCCIHPIIGIAQGAVFGGALGLLALCDYVYIHEKTKLCFSEVKLGLAPAVISKFILNKCSDNLVRPLMISGELFDSAQALNLGLVHQIYSDNFDLDIIFNQFSSNGTDAMRATKKLLNSFLNKESDQIAKKLAIETISQLRISSEAQAKLQAKLQKFLIEK